jgi:hypothetical protein
MKSAVKFGKIRASKNGCGRDGIEFSLRVCFWLAGTLWWDSDPFFGVLLIMSLGMLIFARLTAIIYGKREYLL